MAAAKAEESQLIADIEAKRESGDLSFAKLRTDDRVLARITDGIYRQPSSALRELISNAYDADASRVIIQTDAPRFSQISIRDDGNGMDVATLARLIHHIGGSSKRRWEGAGNTTNTKDPTRSPAGRRLIGKIGIGLFSVAQLTRHFQIVTKVAGSNFRLVAEVILRTYEEDSIQGAHSLSAEEPPSQGDDKVKKEGGESEKADKEEEFEKIESGEVAIRSVPADDLEAHGTEIILMDLRPLTISLLRSGDVWKAVSGKSVDDSGIMLMQPTPRFHIGILDDREEGYALPPRLPWENSDPPEERFSKLFQAVVEEVGVSSSDPKLELLFDNYFKAIWSLSLAAPVDYLEDHPFDLDDNSEPDIFELHPFVPGQAKALKLKLGESIRKRLELKSPERGANTSEFRVFVDDIELKRPIRFSKFPASRHAMKTPLVFVGKADPDLSAISEEERGGDLEFEAYFLWSPKVVPRENTGLLVRIGDASGTLFDETFAKYQVSEITRLRQITAEVFVTKGLDPALNIDRESFNASHPHYQYLSLWVHRSLRQIVNTLKYLADQLAQEAKSQVSEAKSESLKKIVRNAVKNASGESIKEAVEVVIATDDVKQLAVARKEGKLALNPKKVFASANFKKGRRQERENETFRAQIVAVAQVLEAYGLLAGLTYEQQEEVLKSIVAIFRIDGK
ncbi:ATP-binding protein [Haloferula sp. BvORR071]|uniref:ATP-binding protein n=1 Tax=Haloferula sp. BvORR071 TaxID=1396141 RepID=UPI00054F4034|nr:ATP-binding protein [Haloferula sp. BvORR071]